MKQRNYVHKHANKFNRASTHRNRKHDYKRAVKHRNRQGW